MAVNLTTTDEIDFGDVAGDAGLTEITVALTVNISSLANDERLASHWGNVAGNQAWLLAGRTSDNLVFAVNNGAANYSIWRTNTNDVTGLVRIVATWTAPNTMAIWVNGVSKSLTVELGATPASIANSATTIEVGAESASAVHGVDGDYSEFAIWDHKVPDWVAVAYGNGYSPNVYRNGGILYSRMLNTTDLKDLWRGASGTGSGAADAAHPRMFYPHRRQVFHAEAGGGGGNRRRRIICGATA